MQKEITMKILTLSKLDTFNESYYIPLPGIVCVLSKLICSKNVH